MKTRLGVNVDHVATIRQARDTRYPDPVAAAIIAEAAGADQITVHLREDRRHIQDRDVRILREVVTTRLNLEMAMTSEMLDIALTFMPDMVTIVPERREERTTEGGLDCTRTQDANTEYIHKLKDAGILVSLFIDPDPVQIRAAARQGAAIVELHTGDYAEAGTERRATLELQRLRDAAASAEDAGLLVSAGHGLDYHNVAAVAAITQIEELNIGHSIVARALLSGFDVAVRDMIAAMRG